MSRARIFFDVTVRHAVPSDKQRLATAACSDSATNKVAEAEKKRYVKEPKVDEEEYGFHAPESDESEEDYAEPGADRDEDADMISDD